MMVRELKDGTSKPTKVNRGLRLILAAHRATIFSARVTSWFRSQPLLGVFGLISWSNPQKNTGGLLTQETNTLTVPTAYYIRSSLNLRKLHFNN